MGDGGAYALQQLDALRDRLRHAEAEIERLRGLLDLVVPECSSLHHSAKYRHAYGDACPIEEAIAAVRTGRVGG